MSLKSDILKDFDSGMTFDKIIEKYSRKSAYKYLRLFLLIQCQRELNRLIMFDDFEFRNVPELRALLKRLQKW